VRKLLWTVFSVWFCGLLVATGAGTYPLADGTTVTGDVVSFNDNGIIFRQDGDKYTDRVPWIKFSQDGLKQLAQNPKIAPFVDPFIETPPPTQSAKPAVQIQDMSQVRLSRPASGSLLGGLISSPLGLLVLLLIYAANIYAGYEIASFRTKPVGLVMGVAAVAPIVGPIIFLSMIPPPEQVAPVEEAAPAEGVLEEGISAESISVEAAGETPPPPGAPPPAPGAPHTRAPGVPHTYALPGHKAGEINIVASSWSTQSSEAETPQTQIYLRGQYMFNRRFFETRFPGFFGSFRSEEDRGKELVVKTAGGETIVERVAKVTNNDAQFEVMIEGERKDVVVAFSDIQEIRLRAKSK
jgi:hypothetical protein